MTADLPVPDAPVMYVGTFSKTLFPSLRLGFVVLPQALAAVAGPLLKETLRGGHRHEQLALAEFIESGQFSRHLGRMRRLYRSRQALLREALAQHLSVPHVVLGGDSGMHLTVRLPPEYPDQAIAGRAPAFDLREVGAVELRGAADRQADAVRHDRHARVQRAADGATLFRSIFAAA